MSELVKELRKIASDGLLTAPLMIPFHYASLAADEIESLLARIAELERTDMDKMRAQAIADADDLTALAERSAVDEGSVRGFESVLSTFRKQILISKKDADTGECVLIEMYKRAQQAKESAAPVQQAPAEAVQPYPEGNVVGPCICGSWPGGKCFKCPRIEAGAAQQVPEGVAQDTRDATK